MAEQQKKPDAFVKLKDKAIEAVKALPATKVAEKIADTVAEKLGTETPEMKEAKKINDKLIKDAKTYLESIEAPKEEIEKLQRLAEQQTQVDLQGGWEWMGLTEAEQEKKYAMLSRAYLRKTQNEHDQIVFKVRPELDYSENTKFGIGAGHLLPPSVKAVEITDVDGNKKRGTRQAIAGSKIGYYDENGEYLRIFGGYEIRPLESIDEESEDYKKSIELEKAHFQDMKTYEASLSDTTQNISEEESSETGIQASPIHSIRSLETATKESLDKTKISEMEKLRILASKTDLKKIKALCGFYGIGIGAHAEIEGGSAIVSLDGKGGEMLGWTSEQTNEQVELFEKYSKKEFIDTTLEPLKIGEQKEVAQTLFLEKTETGFTFKNNHNREVDLEMWTYEQAAKTGNIDNANAKTAKFVKAMQNGTEFNGYNFIGNYEFNVAHLETLHNLANNDPERFKELCEKTKSPSGKIDSKKFIEELSKTEMPDQGLSLEEILELGRKNPNYRWLTDPNWTCDCHKKGKKHLPVGVSETKKEREKRERREKEACKHVNIHDLIAKARNLQGRDRIRNIAYNWNIHKNKGWVGKMRCAFTISDVLSLGGSRSPNGKKHWSVTSGLAPALIQANLEKSKGKSTGIIVGMENYREGDAVIWRGGQGGPQSQTANGFYKNYGHNRFSHVGIVRHVLTIRGEKYLAIQHNSDQLYIDIVPVKPGRGLHSVKKGIERRNISGLISGEPSDNRTKLEGQLKDIFDFRKSSIPTRSGRSRNLVRVKTMTEASTHRTGQFAFAIRTAHLQR